MLGGLQVYVIGGLVDRTVQKGASLKLAERCGAVAVRLPIVEHFGPLTKGKGVLNVNDVFLVLLALHGGEGWSMALERAIPQRFRVKQQQRQPASEQGGQPLVAAEQELQANYALDGAAVQARATITGQQAAHHYC